MIKIFTTLVATFIISACFAQVKQNIVIEHFTNTRCGICSSRNPGLFTNLENNPEVIHIAVHPSRPYSTCKFYQHNTTENDARTNYYSILGGTPRIVINGSVQSSSTSFTSSTLFDAFKNKTSPISITLTQEKWGTDSIGVEIKIKAVASHSYTTATLYAPLVEDSVNYSAPNGEKLHHNVFRKLFYSGVIQVPANGDSLVLNYTLSGNAEWNFAQLKSMAFIQETSTKAFIQSAQFEAEEPIQTNSLEQISAIQWNIFPNPAQSSLQINSKEAGKINLYNAQGKLVKEFLSNGEVNADISSLPSGVYTLSFKSTKGVAAKQFVKL